MRSVELFAGGGGLALGAHLAKISDVFNAAVLLIGASLE